MKVLHVITGLNEGGAEGVLFRLCKQHCSHKHVVVSLSDTGKYGPLLIKSGVKVYTLDMEGGRSLIPALIALRKIMLDQQPDIVQTWMYHADLLGGVAARITGIKALVWGVRHTTLEPTKSKKATLWIAKLLAKFSWWMPARIVVCARRAMDVHEALGYDRSKMRFIPNGYDLSEFKPNPEAVAPFCREIGVEAGVPLLGVVGRFDPQKDHATLLRALAVVRLHKIPFQCLLAGRGIDETNLKLVQWIENLGLSDCVRLLGSRGDIPKLMNALSMYVLSSSGEAFPNVVAEAMACGTPCVVTDVGDARFIVGDTGWVVPPGDSEALAIAIEAGLNESLGPDWPRRGEAARQRISENFSIDQMVRSFAELWAEVRRDAS